MPFAPFTMALVALAGFAFATAAYHGMVAYRRRRPSLDALFAFGLLCLGLGIVAESVQVSARDVTTMRWAMRAEILADRPFWFAWLYFLRRYADVPRRWHLGMVAVEATYAIAFIAFIATPYGRDVTAVELVTLPWGEQVASGAGTPIPGHFLLGLRPLLHGAYIVALTIHMVRRGRRGALPLLLTTLAPLWLLGVQTVADLAFGMSLPLASLGVAPPILLISAGLSQEVVDAANTRSVLAARERFLVGLLDSMTDAVIVADAKDRILRVNPVAREWLEIRQGDALGTALRLRAPESRELIEVRGDRPTRAIDAVHAGSDGDIPVSFALSSIQGPDGAPAGSVALLRDRAEQARVEAQIRHNGRLEAVGQLSAGIAHDFNNILTSIETGAEVLRSRVGRADPDLVAILDGCQRAGELTQRLLAFSGRSLSVRHRRDPADLLADVAPLLRRGLGPRVELEVRPSPRPSVFECDVAQVESALVSLAVNARDAMGAGGRLTFDVRHETLETPRALGGVELPPGFYAVIDVRDEGSGIAPEHLPRLFQPFFTTRRDQGASGLGLAAVAATMKDHGGAATVESRVGVGTSFSLWFPAAPAAALARRRASGTQRAVRPLTVLVIDDDRAVLRSTCRLLRSCGHQVLDAPGGQAAVALLMEARHPIDVVMLDMVMPDLDGPATLEHLRTIQPDLPILLYSGYTDDAILRDVLAHDGVDFIGKPFRKVELLEKLARVADGEVSVVQPLPVEG